MGISFTCRTADMLFKSPFDEAGPIVAWLDDIRLDAEENLWPGFTLR